MTVAERKSPPVPTPHRWTVEDYLRADEAGIFGSQRVELLEGEIIDMAAQNEPHVWAMTRLAREMFALFPDPFWVRIQATLRLNDRSAPEPDIAILPTSSKASAEEFLLPVLVVEVSDSSLHYDRGRKTSLYAANGIADYWVADVGSKQVEVFRSPARDASKQYGWGYQQITVYKLQDRIEPLAAPGKSVAVAAFLG